MFCEEGREISKGTKKLTVPSVDGSPAPAGRDYRATVDVARVARDRVASISAVAARRENPRSRGGEGLAERDRKESECE